MSCSMSRDQGRAARFIEGELPEEEHEAFERHFLECPECLALMQALAELPAVLSEPRPVVVPARRWRPIGLAAFAAVAASLVLWLGIRTPDNTTVLRGAPQAVVELLPLPAPLEGIPSLTWAPIPAANRYRVDVFSEDGRTVWTREVDHPPALWPTDVPRVVGLYRWRIEALAAGTVIARSPLGQIEIAR
jgi:Putative zinc-finger